jgi:predicted Na+-dependent transporter
MSFLYGLIDLILLSLITLDTLGLVGQYNQKKSPESKDYVRVCFTWIFFLTLKSFTPNDGEGYFRKILMLLFLLAKLFVVLPILGGTMLIYNKSPELIQKGVDVIKSKLGTNVNPINEGPSETSTAPSTRTALSPDEN